MVWYNTGMDFFRENLKYMLFEKKTELGFSNSEFGQYIASMARNSLIGEERFRNILLGVVKPEEMEKSRLFELLQIDDESRIRFENEDMRDLSVESIRKRFVANNIAELFSNLQHGDKEKVANELGVNPSTITRWKRGEVTPSVKTLGKIARFFGLESAEAITGGYLFYKLEPATIREKRDRIVEKLLSLDDATFDAIYPALERLVRE